jgi:hypothetical protein
VPSLLPLWVAKIDRELPESNFESELANLKASPSNANGNLAFASLLYSMIAQFLGLHDMP